ncbi:thiol peroxidase, atypical 2-Cys peroxiredoxin [Capnocytophaga haemolytica]|uniref:Thiol peroxidase n=1 Tax=Capnocytophaga haemolytica TaxID=45243 RepID=A0AAX2H0M8_9FLAO|nr:thiol peroxidase [Capnocytophaga haemolytica]AMD85763.1 lipid hydroperoxide peroxidase [Capnocytophaga haemolytica]SFN83226.1 thiol peroxidase, atypical 2-Cys peroxiredoxin [Capnocytophaga haemolytica]SNV16005.1 Probable thiol peroxidase [Capnocytophaga haemolytica]
MAKITFHNEPAHTVGELPKVGSTAPDFKSVSDKLAEVSLHDFKGKKVVLNIFPSVDTGVCAASVRRFHKEASELNNVAILCISKDLPFALGRFCAAEGIDNLTMLSDFRGDFSAHYPVVFTDSPLKGLLSRAIIVLDENGKVVHTEQVAETTDEPNYVAALAALK